MPSRPDSTWPYRLNKGMRASEVFESHSDIDILFQEVRSLNFAGVNFDLAKQTVSVHFLLDTRPGTLILRAKPKGLMSAEEVLARKLYACARSESRGKPIKDLAAA